MSNPKMIQEPRLNRCPFCGNGINTMVTIPDGDGIRYEVWCSWCGARVVGQNHFFKTMQEAADAWNTRGGVLREAIG